MQASAAGHGRRPRFRRAAAPPSFRLTADDVQIVRVIAQHRLIRSTQIAAMVGRSLDRTNDRLLRLFHAGYVDRPRAQLDYYPTSGSAPMIYALANRGVRLLRQTDGAEFRSIDWNRKNREAGRPFIEHQIAIVEFQVALRRAVDEWRDLTLIDVADMLAGVRNRAARHPFTLPARVSRAGVVHEFSVVPDLVFGLCPASGGQRNFAVEIDRGTMPVRRSDFSQTSIEKKLLGYLAAHSSRAHGRALGWKNFRVLVVTTDRVRLQKMIDTAAKLRIPRGNAASLFLFTTYSALQPSSLLISAWIDASGRAAGLI